MRLAIHQTAGSTRDAAANLESMAASAADAAREGARLLVLPELYLTGYNIGEAVGELAEPADGPSARRAAEIARANDLAILYGYPAREGDELYNAAQLVDRDGRRVANHRKLHLPSAWEKRVFRRGGALTTCTIDGVRLGILVCYDVEFPESVRSLALAGAQVVLVPTALTQPYDRVSTRLVPTRAFENGVFVAYADRVGAEDDVAYCAGSCIVGPDGLDIARARRGEELVVADIDIARIAEVRDELPFLADRRPEIYRLE